MEFHCRVEHLGSNRLVGRQRIHELLDARATGTTLEIFHKGKRVASHQRSYKRGGATTLKEHMPRSHREHAEWTPSRVISWAKTIGPQAGHLVEKILETKIHPEQGFRSALGIIRLEKKYGKERVELACGKALEVGAHSYKFVEQLLKNKMDFAERNFDCSPMSPSIDPETKEEQLALLGAENIRGGKYYH